MQIDDISARINGDNHYCQVVCNPLFTAYFTTKKKDRLSVLEILADYAPSRYLYNHSAKSLLDTLGVGQITKVTEACGIAYYQQQTDFPVIETLLADDAPPFKLLTKHLSLCWIHDARHYKKICPILEINQITLASFRHQYWAYYTELLKYQRNPSPDKREWLTEQFDDIFTTITDYDDLNDHIAKTLVKKTELLRVLDLPKLPLHNNASELAARVQAPARDISFQTRSDAGTKIKDTFMSINETAKKLGVSFYDYVYGNSQHTPTHLAYLFVRLLRCRNSYVASYAPISMP